LTYFSLRALCIILFFIPRPISLAFGRLIGFVVYKLYPKRINVARINIRKMLPELSKIEHENILYDSYKHFGMVLIDFFKTATYSTSKINALVDDSSLEFKNLGRNDGGIIMTAHIGNWEMIIPAMSAQMNKFSVVVQTQKNKSADRFFHWIRSWKFTRLIPKDSSLRQLLSNLQSGYFVGLASDQNARKSGSNVRLFSNKVSLPLGATKLHIKTGKEISLIICLLDSNFKYKILVENLSIDTISPNAENNQLSINQLFANRLEHYIREHPRQYFWFHRIFSKELYDA